MEFNPTPDRMEKLDLKDIEKLLDSDNLPLEPEEKEKEGWKEVNVGAEDSPFITIQSLICKFLAKILEVKVGHSSYWSCGFHSDLCYPRGSAVLQLRKSIRDGVKTAQHRVHFGYEERADQSDVEQLEEWCKEGRVVASIDGEPSIPYGCSL